MVLELLLFQHKLIQLQLVLVEQEEQDQIQILLHQDQYQLLVQLHQQVVVMVHLQDLIQAEHLVVQVAELVRINLILEVMVINHPYHLLKVILVVTDVEVALTQDLLLVVAELVVVVDQYKEHLQIQKVEMVVMEQQVQSQVPL
jgi:hypothetical protein